MAERTGEEPRRAGLPIAWLLALTLAGLVTLAAVPPVLLGYLGARDNTARLLRDRAELTLDAVIDPVSARLERVRDQLAYVAQAVLAGDVDPADAAAMRPFLLGALAATPQVARLAHVRPDRTVTFYDRDGRGAVTEAVNEPASEQLARDLAAASREQRWVGPLWSPTLLEPILTLRQPLTASGASAGTVVAAVTVRSLAREVADAAAGLDATPFILFGQDRVLAHPLLAAGPWRRPADGGLLPRIGEVGDLTLGAIWTERNPLTSNAPFRGAQEGHWNLGPEGYAAFVYQSVDGFGDEPWLAGFHNPGAQTRRERWVVLGIGLAGLLLLLLALAVAVQVARRLSRPILELAGAARRIERLDFAEPVAYRAGPIAEVDEARRAFARMGEVLARTQVYLPRRLVERILAAGGAAGASETREVTTMFCDLEGFTAFSRGRPAEEVADYVNGLLRRVGPAIEAEGGTIDKYTGDGVMAFWGAPEQQPDHAARALRAARAIAVEVATLNARRRARGLPACRLRVGLNTGPAVVGNIGFEGRVAYTALGEAVNAAQRLEQRGRGLAGPGEEVAVVASAATLDAAAPEGRAGAVALEPVAGLPPAFRLALFPPA